MSNTFPLTKAETIVLAPYFAKLSPTHLCEAVLHERRTARAWQDREPPEDAPRSGLYPHLDHEPWDSLPVIGENLHRLRPEGCPPGDRETYGRTYADAVMAVRRLYDEDRDALDQLAALDVAADAA